MISITVGKCNPKRRGELMRLDRGVGGWKGGQGETRGPRKGLGEEGWN